MKILCTADVHIGRRPTRLPERVDLTPLSCARAWERVVDRAIAERVDLLLVAGDLVDQANRFYEAAGPVEAGVRALESAGIPLIAVAGNHDHDSLAWLADRHPDQIFRLLGRGGVWERHTVERDGKPVLHIDGWSFPQAVVRDDPLLTHPKHPRDGVPVLGVLHADLDQPASRHAPVSLAALRGLPVDFWLLGHIHRAGERLQVGAATVLYPGSPQAMDPGEPGLHGPWLVEVGPGGHFSTRALALATVRYQSRDVEMDGVEDEGDARGRVVAAVKAAAEEIEAEAGPLRYLSLRLRLVGRTPLDGWLRRADWSEVDEFTGLHAGFTPVVERVDVATRPALDLEALARGNDAPALLARLLIGLESGTPGQLEQELLRDAAARIAEVERLPRYSDLGMSEPAFPENRVREILQGHALSLLDALLAGREAA